MHSDDGGDCDSNSANDADVGDAAVDDDSDDDGKQQRKQVKLLKQYSQWQNDTEGARGGGDDHHCNATFPSRQGGTLKPEKRESRTMSWHGVYSRMHDDARSKPFRNCAQIVVSEKSWIYSAFSRPGENTRTEIPITWLEESTFIVDWTRVCRHWSTAAIFHQHREK